MSTRQKAAASGKKTNTRKGAFNLGPVLEALGKRVPKSKLAEAQAFAQAFYKRMSAEEFAEHGADGWAALAAGMLEFAAVR